MTHIINRLQFELVCPDEEQAFRFRHQFGITFQEQIVEAADVICTNHAGENEWLRIDKIEIDLGYFSPDSFDANFAVVFKNKFEKELTAKLSRLSSTEKKASLSLSKMQLFLSFLQTGMLPWWAGESDINTDAIAAELMAQQPHIIRRFFYQSKYKKDVWIRAALQLNKETKTGIISLLEELKIAKTIFLAWFQQLIILLQNEPVDITDITDDQIDQILLTNAPLIFQNLKEPDDLLVIFENNITDFFKEKTSVINAIILNDKPLFLKIYQDEWNSKSNEGSSVEAGVQKKPEQKIFLPNDDAIVYQEEQQELIGKHLVKQAGIILLAPFFKPFFTNLRLLNGNEWTSKSAQYKAVHLLKFLSSGEQKMPEYNLTLEKILCGLYKEEPIPLDIVLEQDDMQESIDLLQSVIEHWKAIKNTSVNGLRESFLKRDGLLSQKENDWLLQVERKTLDVLIDSIPWGYSKLSFPWNANLILVEW